LVQAVLETFPGATIAAVRERFAAVAGEAEPGVDPADTDTDAADTDDASTREVPE
jgi:hypothetical protein